MHIEQGSKSIKSKPLWAFFPLHRFYPFRRPERWHNPGCQGAAGRCFDEFPSRYEADFVGHVALLSAGTATVSLPNSNSEALFLASHSIDNIYTVTASYLELKMISDPSHADDSQLVSSVDAMQSKMSHRSRATSCGTAVPFSAGEIGQAIPAPVVTFCSYPHRTVGDNIRL